MGKNNKKIVFLSWHNSLPGMIRTLYHNIPYEKFFIVRNYIKPPRLYDEILMNTKNSLSYDSDIEVINKIIEIKPNYVLLWNGDFNDIERGYQKTIIDILKNKQIKIVYAEHGWLPQKGTFTIDNKGSNGSSENVKLLSLSKYANNELLERTKDFYKKNISKPPLTNYIFIPLQIKDDTQIVKYSPYFKDMITFINYICKEFPKSKKVFKIHPKDKDKLLIKEHIEKLGSTAFYIDDLNAIGWGYYSDFIISINSTLINELLLFHKKIITFGINYFSNKGVTLESNPNKPLNYNNFIVDKYKINRYLTGLLNIQFDSKNPDIIRILNIINKND